jgi:hypothetical protein
MERIAPMDKDSFMSQDQNGSPAPVEEIQKEWHDLTLRVRQLETERGALDQENKNLRALVERVVEHRQRSHSELVTLLTSLVAKLPLNDLGVVVARLVEHNTQVTQACASLAKGRIEDNQLQPEILKVLEKTKRELAAAVKPAVEELIRLDAPFEDGMLQSLLAKPDNFFLPPVVRASRGFVKAQVPRERIAREFGAETLIFFKDVTTDVKFNPRPKPEEIMLSFQNDFEALFQQNPNVAAAKRVELLALYQKIRRSKDDKETARAQKNAFLRLSFAAELLYYYENQSTESPDVIFAQRLPPLIEQLVITGERDVLDEKMIQQAEGLLAFIIANDYRNSVINNIGKGGGLARTLRFALAFRAEKFSDIDPLTIECVKHLIPQAKAPPPETLTQVLRLFNPHMQQSVLRAVLSTDRLRREDAEKLGKAVAKELGLEDILTRINEKSVLSPEREQKMAWDNIKDLIGARATPAEVVAAIRKRLQTRYDADEVRQSWLVLTEADPMVFIRVVCLFPYLPDGQTDPIAKPVLEAYVTRLTHEKYAATYTKVLNALKNLYKVKNDSPALLNFLALVKWVDTEAAARLGKDIGMNAP